MSETRFRVMGKAVEIMENKKIQWRRPGRGRPRNDDRGEILSHFANEIANGRSVSEIARAGLSIWGYIRHPDSKTWNLVVLRHLKGATLERRYRQLRKEIDQSIVRANTSPVTINANYIGIGVATHPQSFINNVKLQRGRPKKTRQR